jgi:indole-3-glycerol phosphate synthase
MVTRHDLSGWNRSMADFLDTLAQDAQKTIRDGYYATAFEGTHTPCSLTKAILACTHAPVITEIKFASPSRGRIREEREVERIASRLQKGGAVAISILTEPLRSAPTPFSSSTPSLNAGTVKATRKT